ncbi:MAG: hypothetical protein U0528_11890 [Anaerolineae bacterium]
MRRATVLTVVLGICFFAPILPWLIRNYQVKTFVLISLNDGSNLYQAALA